VPIHGGASRFETGHEGSAQALKAPQHLLADTGNKNKHLRPREGFLPITGVKLKLRVPSAPKSVTLLRTGEKLSAANNSGWLEITVPRVLIHEAVQVELA